MTDAAAPAARGRLAGTLLVLGTLLHLAAIIFPFVEMRTLLSTAVYGLIPSVVMLIDYGMVVLAVLVVAFSIVFPFAKLAVLWRAWSVEEPSPGLGRGVRFAEALGKWSMLDVFLVLLLLVVTHDRTLVATRPLLGVPCFLGGVVCTMWAGSLLAHRWPAPAVAPALARPRVRWLLLPAAAALACAQVLPLLETDSMLVSDRAFSLVGVVISLAASGSWGLMLAVAATLIVVPWLALAVHLRDAGRPAEARGGLAAAVRHWAMLDVFGLALAIFIVESANAVPSDLRAGAVALALAVILSLLAAWRLRR